MAKEKERAFLFDLWSYVIFCHEKYGLTLKTPVALQKLGSIQKEKEGGNNV